MTRKKETPFCVLTIEKSRKNYGSFYVCYVNEWRGAIYHLTLEDNIGGALTFNTFLWELINRYPDKIKFLNKTRKHFNTPGIDGYFAKNNFEFSDQSEWDIEF